MKRSYWLGIIAGSLALVSGAVQAAPLGNAKAVSVASGGAVTLQKAHWEHRRYHRRYYYAPRYYRPSYGFGFYYRR